MAGLPKYIVEDSFRNGDAGRFVVSTLDEDDGYADYYIELG